MYFIITILILVADIITKYMVQRAMEPYESIPVLKNIFHITYVQNTGAAFSILKGKTLFFTVVSFAAILLIVYILIKYPIKEKVYGIVMAMILGGAVGNLIDRLRYGYVVDFLDFRIWPVFNIADCAIVIGVLILTYLITFHPEFQSLYSKNRR
ncbi:MAG TPA: signal peptidase II [Thermoanaerobacterales bacterium]|nr:signal peptidase II [Thermoanaerobacterales bacterium]